MPVPASAYATVTALSLTAFNLTVNVRAVPSTALGELIESLGGASSSMIVISVGRTTLPWSLSDTTVTVTSRLGASWVLSTAVMTTVSDAFAVLPAAMVIVESIPTV